MATLPLPLHGVKIFMDFMIMIDQLQERLGLAVPEESSTHPSWERRRDTLLRAHDPFASTHENYLTFTAPVKDDAANAGTGIKQLSYGFPRDPADLGSCIGVVRFGDVQDLAIVERTGSAVHFYKVAPHEQVTVEILEPHRSLSNIVTTVTNRDTGAQQKGTLLAWQLPTALYGDREANGIQVAAAMRLTPKTQFANALHQVVAEPAARRAAMASLARRLKTDCETGVAFGKGGLDERDMLARSRAAATTHANEMTAILGAAAYARLQALLQKDPIVQKGLELLKK
jgi:hypothetical protein